MTAHQRPLRPVGASLRLSDAAGSSPGAGLILRVLLGLAVLGALVVLCATRAGIGLSTDSVAYIDGARRLARGDGFTGSFTGQVGPITHWPPLYPALLAGLGLLGIDPLVGARVLAPLLFGANVFVAGWIVWRHDSGKMLPALASSVLVLVSADLLEIHSWGWSEPLFILLASLGTHHLTVYLGCPRLRGRLGTAAALVGFAALTRFVGVAVILAGGVAILWLASGRWLQRGVDAVLFTVASATPLALWMLRSRLLSGSSTDRELVLHPIGLQPLLSAERTVSAWLVPPILPGRIRALLLIAVLAAIVFGVVREPTIIAKVTGSPGSRLLKTLLCFVVVYGGFIALSITLLDADVTYDARILSPIHFLLLVAVGLILAATPRARTYMWAGVAAVALLQAAHAARWVRTAGDGLGYAGRVWRESALWGVIARLPERVPLYSNAYDAIYIHTGRATRPLPGKFNPNSLVVDDQYRHRLAALRSELAENSGVVIYFPLGASRTYMPTEAELQTGLAPFESRRVRDGTLYRVSR